METETGKHQETKKDRKMPTPQERNLVRPIAYNQMIDALVKKKKAEFYKVGFKHFLVLMKYNRYL